MPNGSFSVIKLCEIAHATAWFRGLARESGFICFKYNLIAQYLEKSGVFIPGKRWSECMANHSQISSHGIIMNESCRLFASLFNGFQWFSNAARNVHFPEG